MAKEEPNTNKSIGDVDNIRKILFGDQISQVEERFHQDENAISQLWTENRNLRQALEAEVTARENATQELRDLLASLQKTQEEIWNKNIATQDELVTSIENALGKFKSEITTLPK